MYTTSFEFKKLWKCQMTIRALFEPHSNIIKCRSNADSKGIRTAFEEFKEGLGKV